MSYTKRIGANCRPRPRTPAQWLQKPTGESGIYCLRNLLTGWRYIGSSGHDLNLRRLYHVGTLRRRVHKNPRLQHDADVFGLDVFDFVVLEECHPNKCIAREQFWMDFLRPEYNIQKVAGSCIGTVKSPKTRGLMRERALTSYANGRKPWNFGKTYQIKYEDRLAS